MINNYWLQKNLYFLNFGSVREFQKYYGLEPDGVFGSKSASKMDYVIKNIQKALGCTMIDGMAGSETTRKTKEFQAKVGTLIVDGICGQATRNALENSEEWNFKHFKKEEFTCKCGCGQNNISYRLVGILEEIRTHFGNNPVIITSGCRCAKHNKNVGGVSSSQHIFGKATDFYIQNVNNDDVVNYCKQLVKQGILAYTYTNNSNMKGVTHINI